MPPPRIAIDSFSFSAFSAVVLVDELILEDDAMIALVLTDVVVGGANAATFDINFNLVPQKSKEFMQIKTCTIGSLVILCISYVLSAENFDYWS